MTGRDRFLMALRHQEPDQIPVQDTPWESAVARWRREGLPADHSPASYFGYEWAGMGADVSFQFPAQVIEETDTWAVERDVWGVLSKRYKGIEGIPDPGGFPVNSRRDWDELKPRLAWNDGRVGWEGGLAANRRFREEGKFVVFAGGFGYDRVQRFVSAPRVLEAMLEEPDWVKEMFDTIADTLLTACDAMIARGFRFDGTFIWNDMAYRGGPFYSPAVYRALEFPAQKRLCDFFHSHDMPVILHTDGNIKPLIPMLIEAGFDCLQPLEVKAGMDLVEMKQAYGDRLAFMGGIDVRAMADPDPAVIEREIARKIPVAKKGGGYIYHCDHSVPENVSFAQYCRTIELVRQYGKY